jgi:hypothetical protein
MSVVRCQRLFCYGPHLQYIEVQGEPLLNQRYEEGREYQDTLGEAQLPSLAPRPHTGVG